RRKLADLVTQIDPTQKCDATTHAVLLELADEFIETATRFACEMAKHRGSSALDPKDLQMYI
ncbi:transcription initiation factor, partial [Blastocladiella britannica]